MSSEARLEAISSALSIPVAERHIFLCADQTNDKCAPREETNRLWRHLKSRLKALGITSPPPGWQNDGGDELGPFVPGTGSVLRSKVDCLRICESGCVAVVYPEGTWYANLDEAKMDRIIDQHLVGGRPVAELAFWVGTSGPAEPT